VNWEMLIIPLIALGVWILSAIFRGAEEERDKERLAKPPEQGRRMRQPRRAQTELDRFLDEARNRRLGAAKPAAEEVPQLREEVPQAVPVAQPVNPRPHHSDQRRNRRWRNPWRRLRRLLPNLPQRRQSPRALLREGWWRSFRRPGLGQWRLRR
jgi:hypothetical protein